MAADRIGQLKARLKRQDEEKEKASQKRLEEIRESQAEFRAEQEAKERAERQERQKLREDARQRKEQEMKTPAGLAWIDAGGRAEEFEREWPQMRTQMLRERALEGGSAVRREQRSRNVRAF